MNPQTVIDNTLCCGCSACAAVCSTNALNIVPNEDGFYQPVLDQTKCINCGKCRKICPLQQPAANNQNNANKSVSKNSSKPPCFAFECAGEIRMRSSTAGGFQIVAEDFIRRGGLVAGAAWGGEDGLVVEHILVDNINDLPKLYKSKYVQSYMGGIYRQTQSALDGGTTILFSGTPCQIAGLYAFLGRDYPNLYTVDLLCHSAPPPQVFRRYLDETFGIDNVQSYEFRYKEPSDTGFDVLKIKVQLKNQTVIAAMYDDVFGKLFLHDYSMGRHCEKCPFAAYPRQGDITLGDFWKIEAFDRHFTGGQTECVLVNNKKGSELAAIIKPAAAKWKRKSLVYLLGNAGTWTHRKAHRHRDRFFQYARTMPVTKAAQYLFSNTYEIGVAGLPCNRNYGTGLTYYALYRTLLDLGKVPLMIELPRNSYVYHLCNRRDDGQSGFKNFPYEKSVIAETFREKEMMCRLNDRCNMFLAGSDQLFCSMGLYEYSGRFIALDWVEDRKKKAAYAASFGTDTLTCSDRQRAIMGGHLKKFDYFSVREQSGVELCRREFGIEAQWVLDPVFLCKKEYYDRLAANGTVPLHTLTAYIRVQNAENENILNDIAAEKALPVYLIKEYDKYADKREAPFIEDFLAAIAGTEFIVTDSFHGICFAVIYQKPFLAVCNKDGVRSTHPERIISLLSLLGLQERIVYDRTEYEHLKNKLNDITDIDWASVNEKLEEAKRHSFAALQQAVAPLEHKKTMQEDDRRNPVCRLVSLPFRWLVCLTRSRYFETVPLFVCGDGEIPIQRWFIRQMKRLKPLGFVLLFRAELIYLLVKRLFRR